MSFVPRMSKKLKPTELQNDLHDQRPKTQDPRSPPWKHLHEKPHPRQTQARRKQSRLREEMVLLSGEVDFV